MWASARIGELVPEEPQGPFARPYWAVIPRLFAIETPFAHTAGTVFLDRPKLLAPHTFGSNPEPWPTGCRRGSDGAGVDAGLDERGLERP